MSGAITTRIGVNTRPEIGYSSIIIETYPIDSKNATRRPDKQPDIRNIIGKTGDPSHTLDTAQIPAIAVCCQQNQRDEVRLTGGDGMVAWAIGVHGVCIRSFARKLTPLECERLMGFPDNWTRISWRGKPPEECPDQHRYRACGNSMCVNVMRWIGKRIDMVDKGIDPNEM